MYAASGDGRKSILKPERLGLYQTSHEPKRHVACEAVATAALSVILSEHSESKDLNLPAWEVLRLRPTTFAQDDNSYGTTGYPNWRNDASRIMSDQRRWR